MSNFTVTVAAKPTVKPSSLFFKAQLDDQSINAVAFFKDLDAAFKDKLTTLDVGDTIVFIGRQKINKYTGKEELIIEKPYRDISPMPAKEIIPVDQRRQEVKKYTFPDGNFFWSDGIEAWRGNGRKAKLTYEFVDKYNSMVTSDKWLLPDWFAIETVARLKNNSVQVKLTEAFATY